MPYQNANLMKRWVMPKNRVYSLAVLGIWLCSGPMVYAQAAHDQAQAALALARPGRSGLLSRGTRGQCPGRHPDLRQV